MLLLNACRKLWLNTTLVGKGPSLGLASISIERCYQVRVNYRRQTYQQILITEPFILLYGSANLLTR